MSTDAKKAEFILKLEALTREYGISIGGCGCCGSPWLDEEADVSDARSGYSVSDGEGATERIEWLTPTDDFGWNRYADKIVRAGS